MAWFLLAAVRASSGWRRLPPVCGPVASASYAAHTDVNPTSPPGVGNSASQAVLAFRHHDGSNQLGDLHAGAYSDYTGYASVNAPMVVSGPFDRSTVGDVNRWQPLTYADASCHTVT